MNPLPKRGEIWLIDLEPTKGDELKKQRPAIVISSDTLQTRSVSLSRFIRKMGNIEQDTLSRIIASLVIAVEY